MSPNPTDSEIIMKNGPEDNFWKKYFGWIKLITVEPVMFLYMMAFMTTSVIEQDFYLYKACTVDHDIPSEVCKNLTNTTLKAKVQVTVSTYLQWNNVASYVVPIVLSLFFGNWSDKRGRKLLLIIGLTGKLIWSIMVVVNSIMDTWSVYMLIYTAALPMGFLGGDVAIFASCFAYISDVSTMRQRTLRVGILDIVYLTTMPTGIALGSYLFSKVVDSSYTIMFSINATLLYVAIVYAVFRLEWRTTSKQKPLAGRNIFVDFFDWKHVAATVKTMTKPRPSHRRLYLWILMLAMALYTFQRNERSMSYLYTKLVFDWNVTTFSTFRTVQSSLYVIAMLIGVPIMSKLLGMRDTLIVATGALAHASGRIVFALAKVPELFYVGTIVISLGPVVAPVLRSMTSKVVPLAERGKVFAMLSVCDNAVPLFSGFFYSQLYNATINTAPNSIYFLTFSTQIAVLLLILIIHFSLGHNTLDSGGPADEDNFASNSSGTLSPFVKNENENVKT